MDSGLKMLTEPAMYWPVASSYYKKKHSHNLSIFFYFLSRASFLPFSLFLRQPLTKKKKRGKEKLKMETHLNAKLSLSHAAAAAASWKCFQRMKFWLKCQPGVNIANKIGLSCIFQAGAVCFVGRTIIMLAVSDVCVILVVLNHASTMIT